MMSKLIGYWLLAVGCWKQQRPIPIACGMRPTATMALCFCLTLVALIPAPGRAEEPAAPTAKNIKMNFKDTPLETVLEQLSEMSGIVIVKDLTIEGRITVISKKDMDVDEAITLLNAVLKEKGYVGIRTGRILKLVKLDEAKKRNIPVRTGSDPLKIEPSDEVITQVIPIKYIDAIQLKKDFAPLIPSYADLTANASSNTLILTDTCSNIRRICEIISAMDTQATTFAEVKVFQLKYANASSAARLITDTFKEEDKTQMPNAPPWMRGGAQFAAAQAGQGDNQQGQRVKKVTASADDRSNAVVVSASPDTMKLIIQVMKELDANPAEEQSVFIYHCKNAQSKNLETVVNLLFGTKSAATGTTQTTNNQRPSATNTNSQSNSNTNRPPGSGGNGGSGGGMGNGLGGTTQTAPSFTSTLGQSGQSSSASTATRPQGMLGDLTGQVFVVADTDTNSLLVLAPPKHFERIKGLIADLDRPIPQVIIKVLIAEVTHEDTLDIGADTSVLSSGSVSSTLTNFGVGAASGGLITKIIADHKDISVTLRALEGVSKLEVLSRPYILASDNQLSTITVGQEVPFIISSQTTALGQIINTIQYQDIGIILNVTAHINPDGVVIMDVGPEVSSLTGTTVPISAGVNAPVFAKRSAQTRVGIKDGQTVVIGGLMGDNNTLNIQGIPFLRKIPGLGALFQRKQNDRTKTELLIFLTPHVATSPLALGPMSDQEKEGLKLVPHSLEKGAFEEHMRGLERGVAPIFLPADNPPPPPVEVPPAVPDVKKPAGDAAPVDPHKP